MTWLGAPLFFLAQNFFVVHVRSFCSNKKLLRKCLWHTNYSTSLITSDVFAKHKFLLLARPYGDSDCTQRHFRMLLTPNYEMQPSVVLFWLHDVRIPWNFNISKSYFSFNMSKMDQFQRNLFNVRNNANAFFRLSIRVKQQAVLMAFQCFFEPFGLAVFLSTLNGIHTCFTRSFDSYEHFLLLEGSIATRKRSIPVRWAV